LYSAVNEPLPWVRNTKTGNNMVLSEPLSCVETPRSRRIWFPQLNPPLPYTVRTRSVNEPLPWVRNTKIGNNMVPSEPPSCVETLRLRRVWFPQLNPPLPYMARTMSVNDPLPWVRNTKTGNSMVPSEPPSCVETPRSRRIWFAI